MISYIILGLILQGLLSNQAIANYPSEA